MSLIQQNFNNSPTDVATVTATFAALPAAAGNIIVAVLSVDKEALTVGAIVGFSAPVVIKSGNSVTLAYCYKVSDGTENSFTQSWVYDSVGRYGVLWVGEIDSAVGGIPDVVAQNDSAGLSVTSLSTGLTTAVTGSGFALGLWAIDTHSNTNAGRNYSNGFSEIFFNDFVDPYNVCGLIVASNEILTGTVESTFSTTDTGDQIAAAMLVFKNQPAAIIDFYLSSSTSTSAIVKCRSPRGLPTALEFSTNSNFANSITTPEITPIVGNDFVVEFNLTGLTPGTQYYYRAIEQSIADTDSGAFKTKRVAGVAGNIKFVFAGDAAVGNNSQTFANIAALTDVDFFMHLGDMHYADITTNTEAAFFTAYRSVFAQSNQRAMFGAHALHYKWDDHDYGPNDSDGSHVAKVSAAAAYRKYIPEQNLNNPSTGSIESAWTDGRVRFIMLDTRYERASGTILGAAQKAWFLAELASAASNAAIQLVIVSVGVPWIATGVADTWSDATAERTEISDAIFSGGLENNIAFICADAHMITHDDGTNNIFDTSNTIGWPVYQSAPLGQTSSTKGGPYSGAIFLEGLTGQYSTMEIADTGSSITVTVEGLSSAEAVLYTHSFNFATVTQVAASASPVNESLQYFVKTNLSEIESLSVINADVTAQLESLNTILNIVVKSEPASAEALQLVTAITGVQIESAGVDRPPTYYDIEMLLTK